MKDKKQMAQEVKEFSEAIENKVKEYLQSDNYLEMLKVVSKFHNYSFNNRLLISLQRPDATYVKSFAGWKKDFNRSVKKGEKAIKIFAPIHCSKTYLEVDEDGNEVETVKSFMMFKTVPVFDYLQTEGEEIEGLNISLDVDFDNFDEYVSKIESFNKGCKIEFLEPENPTLKGYYNPQSDKIVVYQASKGQMFKTLVHETAHRLLNHGTANLTQNEKECQAESVAYVVCNQLGLDTSAYSNAYLASWTSDKEISEVHNGLNDIVNASMEILNAIA